MQTGCWLVRTLAISAALGRGFRASAKLAAGLRDSNVVVYLMTDSAPIVSTFSGCPRNGIGPCPGHSTAARQEYTIAISAGSPFTTFVRVVSAVTLKSEA